jgi:hypothetical protein
MEDVMSMKRTGVIALAGLALGASILAAVPAEAGHSTGTWRYLPYGGYHGYGYRGYGYRGYGYPRYGGYGYGYRGGWNPGAAAAAGVIGGLALGALATAPAYGYGAPVYAAPPPYDYGYGNGYAGDACFYQRQVVYDSWGTPHRRRVLVCP